MEQGENSATRWIGGLTRYPVVLRSVAAVLAGALLFGSFPPRPWWFLAPAGITLLTLVVRSGAGLRSGFGYGFLAGLGFFLPLLPWTGIYVGPLPWLALSTACAVYLGLFVVLGRILGSLPGWPVWLALAWTTAEWGRSSFPFGGFPWGRLAFGQADGWFLPLAAYGGAPLVSFAVALSGTCGAAVVLGSLRESGFLRRVARGAQAAGADRDGNTTAGFEGAGGAGRGGRAAIAIAASTCVLLAAAGLGLGATLPHPAAGDRTITVAAIQGSVPRLGLDFNAQRRAVLDNHVRRTEQLADDVAAGLFPAPDVVVWPENSSDIDPLRNPDAAALISAAARRISAPILVGAVLVNGDGTTTNSVMVWTAESGPEDRHDKKIVQPFGEYLPMRGFFRLFSDYADRAGYFVPGHGDGTIRAAGTEIGVATCYEVAFDRAFRDSLHSGAQLLAVPTNNATFGDSEMTYQQLAMSRVRAVEHGRSLVVAATSGVSALIAADGSVRQESALFVPEALVAEVPLRDSHTPATVLGPWPELVAVLATVAAVVLSIVARVARRRAGTATAPVRG